MASDASIGDVEVPYLDVAPGDETTGGTLTVTSPSGAVTTPTVSAGTPADGRVRLTAAAVTYNEPGRWVLHWQVTGTGASAEHVTVFVVPSPTAGGPTWWPGRSRVANYVPARTLSTEPGEIGDAGSDAAPLLTFDSHTRPTGVMVDRLIADAAARVTARVGTVADSLHDAASVVVAILAAVAVERGWPDDQDTSQSLARARDLEAQADRLLTELATANEAVSGENPNSPGSNVLPRWAFPQPVPWGDELFL